MYLTLEISGLLIVEIWFSNIANMKSSSMAKQTAMAKQQASTSSSSKSKNPSNKSEDSPKIKSNSQMASSGKKQHGWSTGCIATTLTGQPCKGACEHPYVPLCDACMKNGDPSIAVVPHHRFGKMLVAKRDLPKGYKMALWGDIIADSKMPEDDREWGFETADGWFINPCKYPTSQPQFCQCPGPNEKITVIFGQPHLMMENLEGKKKVHKVELIIIIGFS